MEREPPVIPLALRRRVTSAWAPSDTPIQAITASTKERYWPASVGQDIDDL